MAAVSHLPVTSRIR